MSLKDKKHITLNEFFALLDWSDKNDLSGIENLIRNEDISPAARDIIADIFIGKRRRKKGAKSTETRDQKIYGKVLRLMGNGHKLTSSAYNKDGAAAMIADASGLNEDAVIKAYQRIDSKWKPIYKYFYEKLLNDETFWQDQQTDKKLPTYDEFKELLDKRFKKPVGK